MVQSIYLIGTAQPHFADVCDGPASGTSYLTRTEKHAFADALAERKMSDVPLYVHHAGGEKARQGSHFVPPLDRRIGRVVHGMVDRDGNLLTVCELQWDAPETPRVLEWIQQGRHVGLSVGTDYRELDGGVVADKRVNHIGITDDPEYGAEGTWAHVGRVAPDQLVQVVHDKFLSEPGMYVPDATRRFYEQAAAQALHSNEPNKPAAPMSPPLGARQQQHLPRDISLGASRMSTQNETPAADAAPPPVDVVQQKVDVLAARKELEQLADEVIKRCANPPEELLLNDWVALEAVDKRIKQLSATSGLTLDHVPDNTHDALPLLKKALGYYRAMADTIKNRDYASESAEVRGTIDMALTDPVKYRPALVSLFASAKTEWSNQRKAEAELQATRKASQQEDERKVKEMAMELETTKKRLRERDEAFELELKRPRNDVTGTPAPASFSTPPPAGQQQQQGKLMAVGATRLDRGTVMGYSNAAASLLGAFTADKRGMEIFKPEVLNPGHNDSGLSMVENFQILHKRLSQQPFSVFSGFKNGGDASMQ